jgi:uncharacterized protein YjdB
MTGFSAIIKFVGLHAFLYAGLVVLLTVGLAGCKKTPSGRLPTQPVQATGLLISKKTLTIIAGQKDTLIATIQPANVTNLTLVWSSSDIAIATVDTAGVVIAKNVGSATIAVATSDGKLTTTCTVTVNPVLISSLSLNQTSLALVVGGQDSLKVIIKPSNATHQALTWSSSNMSVATVDVNGVVFAKNNGNATIAVSTPGNAFTASCQVTTVANPIKGIKVDSTQFLLLLGTSLKMGYKLTPAGAGGTVVTWKSSNTAAATVQSDGTINALSEGYSNITATTISGGYNSICTVHAVPIGSFLDMYIVYVSSTTNGQAVQSVAFKGFNYALYDLLVSEIDVYNNENMLIGSLKNASGSPVFTLTHAEGDILESPSQSFVISQVEPGATTLQNWPMIVYFNCNNVNYKMTLTHGTNGTTMMIVPI